MYISNMSNKQHRPTNQNDPSRDALLLRLGSWAWGRRGLCSGGNVLEGLSRVARFRAMKRKPVRRPKEGTWEWSPKGTQKSR